MASLDDVVTAANNINKNLSQLIQSLNAVAFGSGAPTLSAAKGSLYLCSDGTTTNDRLYVNTDGSTTWTNVTTAA